MKRLALLIAISGVIWGAAEAAEQGGVSVELTASRVVTTAGREQLETADHARPGEVLEYRATYSNHGNTVAKDVAATLPIPVSGLEYLPQTGSPRAILASLDGKSFSPVPLKRAYRLPDGTEELREVPVTDYRYLRWMLGDLAAGAHATVTARMRVTDDTALRAAASR